ncbi:hypothetical protein [Anaerosinus massiliensis]|uniref:hypothetical protein n=1 Tax=Massilibacillus massiliensis TaxID=1806837 RepID=UPI000DA5EC58|nr:hypothetical protein [Massilibacillus massiliensis]
MPVEEQEYLIENEVKNINFAKFSTLSKTHYNKRIFSRSRNDIYEYPIAFNLKQVEEMCLNELKKEEWIILKVNVINAEKKVIILQKQNLYAFLRFEEKNIFSFQIGYITFEKKINGFS